MHETISTRPDRANLLAGSSKQLTRLKESIFCAGLCRYEDCAVGLRLVLATLRNAMSILGEALILRAIPAAGGYEARKMLLLTGLQTRLINDPIHRCRPGAQREPRA
jgi:hypothetical protein